MQIKYYLDFKEDKRISMDVYGNQLIDYLMKQSKAQKQKNSQVVEKKIRKQIIRTP